MAYRLNQATEGGLSNTNNYDFSNQLLNSYQVIKNTEFSSLVGDANVDYRALATHRGVNVAKRLHDQGIDVDPTKIKTQMLMGSTGESNYQEIGRALQLVGSCEKGTDCAKSALSFATSVDGLQPGFVSYGMSPQDQKALSYLNRGSGYDRTPDLTPMTGMQLINPKGVAVSDLGGGLLVPSASDSPAVVREAAIEFLGDDFRNKLNQNPKLNDAFNERLNHPTDGVVDLRPFYNLAANDATNKTAANSGLIPSDYIQTTDGFTDKLGEVSWNFINLKGRVTNANALNNCDACPQDLQQSHNLSGEFVSIVSDATLVRGAAGLGNKVVVASLDATKAGLTTENILNTEKQITKVDSGVKFSDEDFYQSAPSSATGVIEKSPDIDLAKTQHPITDPARLLSNPARDPISGNLDINYMAPEHSEFPINSYLSPERLRVYIALDQSYQIDPLTLSAIKPGKFSSTDLYLTEDGLRNALAIKNAFKNDITHIQEYEIAPGTRVQESVVGPQKEADDRILNGGGGQIEILKQPNTRSSDFLIPVGKPIPVIKPNPISDGAVMERNNIQIKVKNNDQEE